MSADHDWIHDLFAAFGPVSIRRMFGGAGIFRDDRMFGLVTGGVIYLKADAESRERFREAGCRPFVYSKQGKPTEISYWSAPEAALEDPDVMNDWAALAWEAAARKAAAAPRKKAKAGKQ